MGLVWLVVGVVLAVVLVLTHMAAWVAGAKRAAGADIKEMLGKAKLTVADARLYRRAAQIMSRMVKIADLDNAGEYDILTERSQKLVSEWLTDYNREIDKV